MNDHLLDSLTRALGALVIALVAFATPAVARASCDAFPQRASGATRLMPVQRAARTQEQEPKKSPTPSAAEIAALKKTYDELAPEERATMLATYKENGIDLLKLFGQGAAGASAAPAAAPKSLADAVKRLDFGRTPQKVLDARAQLGFQATPLPAADAAPAELAKWLHQHVLAGDWPALASFLRERAGDDAGAIYAHVLQSTNQGDPGLLPEEILAIAEAAPGVPDDWQLDLLARLLKTSAKKASTGPLLDRLRGGTRLFGAGDAERRKRTAVFLSKAGLAVEAYEFLTPLDEARANGDTAAILAHARYQAARADALGSRPEAEEHRRIAWQLYGEVALADQAELADRRESLQQAIDMLPSIPRGPATAWLKRAFANPAIASAALEAVALKAMSVGDQKIDVAERAQAILTMKDAVDTLLENEKVQIEQLRVPLRMLTLSLVGTVEDAIQKQAPERAVSNETALLLRALPGKRWRDQIEPSLAVRAYKAFLGLAVVADDTDLALDLLSQGVERAPGQGAELADEFLRLWMIRLNPPKKGGRDTRSMLFFGGNMRESGLFTRGRLERNLDVLSRLLDVFQSTGVDGRQLERVVDVFAACHDETETFQREDIVRVLGPIDQLAPAVAARMADTMRKGLSGGWRDVQAQRDKGIKRSQAEVDQLVEQGYQLANELIDVAIQSDPDSWRYAMTRLSLAYDLMQFRHENGRDPGSYAEARAGVFRAFAGAAAGYRAALARGEVRPTLDLYFAWFSIAMGASQLKDLTPENLLTDAVENAPQLDLIRNDMLAMPPDDAQFHIGEFARRIASVVPQLSPDVKAGVMRAAAKLVGDHPAGASLRQTLAVYEDLVRDEVRLRLTIDGSDRVGTEPFGAVLTLRSTAAISRQLDGFHTYLENGVYIYNPNGGGAQQIDYRDRLQKSIEHAFRGKVELLQVGFFASMNPPSAIEVDGKPGWEEKPLAYLVLRATDESADHLPNLQLDLTVDDSTGSVILPVQSNAVLIDAVAANAVPGRPVHALDVHQIVDLRKLHTGDDPVVELQVTATGEGVVPPLEQMLSGVRDALPGYRVADDGVEEQPMTVNGVVAVDRFNRMRSNDDDVNYVEADANGMFRLTTTRAWTVRYQPTGGSVAAAFRIPVLADGYDGKSATEYYDDMDLVEATAATVPVTPSGFPFLWLAVVVVVLGLLGFVVVRRRGRQQETGEEADIRMPEPVTPLAAVLTLQRIERDFADRLAADDRGRLHTEIARIERAYFAEDGSPNGDVREALVRWIEAVRARHP